jgi:hypothetical protein
MASSTGVAETSTATPLSEDDFTQAAAQASHFMNPATFVQTEAANQGLGAPVAAAPVKGPPPGEPRSGGEATDSELGVLAGLRGTWMGKGFNLIARPDKQGGLPFFLELNATKETLEFTSISGPIPNRGTEQDDIFFLGLTYLQRISEANESGGLHIEPGIWINVPATEAPKAPPSIVRLATIPHGNALLAQGKGFEVQGGPKISPASSTPVEEATGQPVKGLGYLDPFLTAQPPAGIPLGAVANPNLVLTEAIKGQSIVKTVVLLVASEPVGGIENIPFLTANATAIKMSAIFWIETIQLPGDQTRLQLQYSQTVVLNFEKINWPHVSVATLVKF